MTPAELLARLCEIHGVENLNQLSQVVDIPAHMLYTWQGKHAPSYENTMRLLESAGVLNFDRPTPPATPQNAADRLARLEEAVNAYREELRELRLLVEAALPQRPTTEHWSRRR